MFKGGLDFEVNIPDYDLKKTPLKLYTNYNDLGDLTSAWNQTTVKAESLLTLSSLQFHSVLDPSDISVSGLEQMTQSGVVIMTEENNTSDLEFYTGSQ
ncbi:hypothetical protein H8D85_01830 [bacterium]|nr:hypothetical protein [bacterium]